MSSKCKTLPAEVADRITQNGKMSLIEIDGTMMVFHEVKGWASVSGLLDGAEWDDYTFPTETELKVLDRWNARFN